MSWRPDEEVQKRNEIMKQEYKSGISQKELAKKYNLSKVTISVILSKGREVKKRGCRENKYIPIKLKPGQVVKLKIVNDKKVIIRKFKVVKIYPNYVLMIHKGIKECFLHYDIWRSVVGGEVL